MYSTWRKKYPSKHLMKIKNVQLCKFFFFLLENGFSLFLDFDNIQFNQLYNLYGIHTCICLCADAGMNIYYITYESFHVLNPFLLALSPYKASIPIHHQKTIYWIIHETLMYQYTQGMHISIFFFQIHMLYSEVVL